MIKGAFQVIIRMSFFKPPFRDREDAGKQLATLPNLQSFKNDPNAIVIGLPRGGVPVAAQVAMELKLPLDIVVPRKIGAPKNPGTWKFSSMTN